MPARLSREPRITGTYIVNTDCTGSASLTYGNGIGPFHFNLIILNNGQDIKFMQYDNGLIVSGGARQQPTNCVLESLNGAYAYTITGSFIDTSGNIDPYIDSGQITFNGTGGFSLSGEISEVGTCVKRELFRHLRDAFELHGTA